MARAAIDPNHHKGLIVSDSITEEPLAVTGVVLTNSVPMHVALVDSNGDQVSSFGGGTQYTEDVAAAANPVGTAVNLIRQDTPASEVSTNGDNVAQRGTTYGAAYVTLLDSAGTPVSVGGGTQYTEDAAAAANPIGNAVNLIRQDTPATLVSTDGDNVSQRGTNYGAAYTQIVTSAGAFVDSFGGGTEYVEDAASPANPTAASINLRRRDSLAAETTTDGDWVTINATNKGEQYVKAVDSDALLTTIDADTSILAGAVSGTEMQVDIVASLPSGTNNIGDVDVLSVIPGTGATNLGKAVDSAAGSTDTGVAPLFIRDDTLTTLTPVDGDYVPGRVDANGSLWVTLGTKLASSTDSIAAVGTVADDATTPGAPVMIGGQAKSPDGTDPGNVSAEDDVARVFTDLNRRLYINDEHPRWWSYHADGSSALTDASVQGAPGAGFQVVITDIIFTSGSATAINMFLEEGSSKILGPIYLEAVNGRGFVWKGKKHVTANTAVTVTTSSATAHAVDILGYIQKV